MCLLCRSAFAANQLGQLGSLAAPALASIRRLAKDDDEKVREAAAAAVKLVEGGVTAI